jgi:myo-inositol-1(or 4)-monophosphatase
MRLPPRADLEEIARRAGAIALSHFGRVAAERKADRSVVTRADREVEDYLVGALGSLLPDAAIVGEEGTARAGRGAARIVIDPIDGTAGFVAGLPTWCICVGILEGAVPVAGVVHLPCAAETYTALQGSVWMNGIPLSPLGTQPEGDRFLVTHAKAHLRHAITYPGKVRSLGSTAYHVALVARGVAEAALVGRAHLWDLAAPGALLVALGGRYEYLSGGPVDLAALADQRASADVIAGTPAALRALRDVVRPLRS